MKFDTVINGEDYTVTFDVDGKGRDAEIENICICELGTETEVEGVYEALTRGDLRELEEKAWTAYDKHVSDMDYDTAFE